MGTLGRDGVVGADILGLITRGMYGNPLVLFREYVQNAVDAFGVGLLAEENVVKIKLDVGASRLTITDNGPGLSHEDAIRDLVLVAQSRKVRSRDAGFRGIGRLVGLAFADQVVFSTRSSEVEPVTQISWNANALRTSTVTGHSVDRSVVDCVTVSKVCGDGFPRHFFEVALLGVARFVSDRILNSRAVRHYISEVCPVGISKEFPYASQLADLVSKFNGSVSPTITIDGDDFPVLRQYGATISHSPTRYSAYTSFESFEVPSVEGSSIAAMGWLAHSTYDGAIPKRCGIRGLRLRRKNIAVGDEKVLDHLFVEERFNRWCVGEVHVLDDRIVPNARRDYFETDPHLRNLENHLRSVISKLERRCRTASADRNRARRIDDLVDWATHIYRIVSMDFVSEEYARALIEKAIKRLEAARTSGSGDRHASRGIGLNVIYERLTRFQGERDFALGQRLSSAEACAYRRVFEALIDVTGDPKAALEIGESILAKM